MLIILDYGKIIMEKVRVKSMDGSEIKQMIREISDSMKKKDYNPINQIVGYLISNDLGYIPDFDDNRNKIAKLNRTSILESMLTEYLK